jgi:hypothetical protein
VIGERSASRGPVARTAGYSNVPAARAFTNLNTGQSPHNRERAASHTQGQFVASFKDPSFQDRVALAAKAREKALTQLKEKPPVDEAVMAERRLVREAREQIVADQRAAKVATNAAVKAEKAAIEAAKIEEAEAAAALKAARLKPADAAAMKAARDARYAARKARNS